MKRVLANLILLFVVFCFGVGAMEIATRLLWPDWRNFNAGRFMQVVDVPEFGTTVIGQPGFDGMFSNNNGDFQTHITINAFGHRESVPVDAADGRVWIVGDSFSFGWGVNPTDTFAWQVGQLAGLKTYNIANPGTNVCGYQAAIARMPASIKPKALVLGLTMENDLSPLSCATQREQAEQSVASNDDHGSFQSFLGLKGWLKNHVAFYNFSVLTLKKSALARQFFSATGIMADIKVDISANNQGIASEAVKQTAKSIEDITALLPAHVPMIVLIIPSRLELIGHDADILRARRNAIAKQLNEIGITTVDPFKDLLDAGFDKVHFENDGHWTAAGHMIAAKALAPALVAAIN